MRVGLLNFHNALNYGAVFQSLALQEIVSSFGIDTRIIDYRNEVIEQQFNFLPMKSPYTKISILKRNANLLPFIQKKRKNFDEWKKHYNLTPTFGKDDLVRVEKEFDKIIVGSDQVWRMNCHGNDLSYFLDFVNDNKKKIAYAASFGSDTIDQKFRDILKNKINAFSFISVREESGKNIVYELTKRKVPVVLDPVILIGSDFWYSKLARDSKYKKHKYVFAYQIGAAKEMPKYVRVFAKLNHLKIVYVTDNLQTMLRYGISANNSSDVGPEMFLRLLYDSECVITNSFHASALSILFKKEFYSFVIGGEHDKQNTRIFDLLNKLGLTNRIVNKDSGTCNRIKNGSCYLDLLDYEREVSKDYLKNAILGDANDAVFG